MSIDYLCKLTDKINQLNQAVNNMQQSTGLYSDSSNENTLTGRVKSLEESVISSTPSESNISRLKVEYDLAVVDGKITTEYTPMGDCINREVMLQDPDDPTVWETVGEVTFDGNVGDLGTTDYDDWKATVTYLYALKITIEEWEVKDVDKELIKDLSTMAGSVYRVIFTITPIDGEDSDEDADACTLRWENADDDTDYVDEDITTEHKRSIDEEDFNHKLKITGSATIRMEIRNRIG